jgi:hypothetical protein
VKDFTIKTYQTFLTSLQKQGFVFLCYRDFKEIRENIKCVFLRYDVDKRPENSLEIARIQAKLGIKGSYYFRVINYQIDEKIIREIESLGHEIGYHYNDLVDCRGNYEMAIGSFEINLKLLRSVCEIQTICMDGSPLSKWNNRDLWKKYNYRDFGIMGEPYFDINTEEVFYITDTGRSWNSKANRRDVMETKNETFKNLSYHSTFDIIKAVENGIFPDKVMMTFHPQRWTDHPLHWARELVWQGGKNVVKRWWFVES